MSEPVQGNGSRSFEIGHETFVDQPVIYLKAVEDFVHN